MRLDGQSAELSLTAVAIQPASPRKCQDQPKPVCVLKADFISEHSLQEQAGTSVYWQARDPFSMASMHCDA